jgi:Dolichyl-phosphate-mannose-protein mannosyltransferase
VSRRRVALSVAACVVAAVALHLPALDQLLDRDTALYAAIGQRLGLDTLPYRDLFDHKQPLIHWLYGALDLIAPQSLAAIRVAAALPSALAAAALLLFLEPVAGRLRAVAAAALVILAGASNLFEATDLNTEHLLTLPAAVCVLWALALDRPGVRGGPFAIGVAGGLAILAKATGLLTALPALIPLLAAAGARGESPLPTVIRFGLGLAVPAALVLAVYAAAGAVDDLVFANLTYNSRYVESDGFTLDPRGPLAIQLLTAAALCSALVRLADRGRCDVLGWTLLAWLVGAWLGAQASGRGFGHYYAPLVPPAAALLALPAGRRLRVVHWGAVALGCVAAVLIALPVVANFGRSGEEIARTVYGDGQVDRWEPADEAGRVLRRLARRGDELYVIGSEPQYYWRSGLPSLNRWLFDYPLTVAPERMRPDVEALCERGPRFVVVLDPRSAPGYGQACDAGHGYRAIMRRGPVTVLERPSARRARG